jgi:hypothetical protein
MPHPASRGQYSAPETFLTLVNEAVYERKGFDNEIQML